MVASSWTAERDANVVRMRNVEHKAWTEIARFLSLSKTACHRRYTEIVPPEQQVKLSARRKWSASDSDRLWRLRFDEKKTFRELAVIFDMSIGKVTSKIGRMQTPCARLQFEQKSSNIIVPQSCLDDRILRYSMEPRDLTAAFCGDPLPGRSALDRQCR